MTAPAEREARPRVLRLGVGDAVALDVEYCDLVPGRAPAEGPQLRFKGWLPATATTGAERVLLFLDPDLATDAMARSGVLREPLPPLPRGETVVALRLEQKRLEIRRVARARGATALVIRPRDALTEADDEAIVRDLRWALARAREEAAAQLQADGFAVGGGDVVAMATELFHARRQRRQGQT